MNLTCELVEPVRETAFTKRPLRLRNLLISLMSNDWHTPGLSGSQPDSLAGVEEVRWRFSVSW